MPSSQSIRHLSPICHRFSDGFLNQVIWDYDSKTRIFLKCHSWQLGLLADCDIYIWEIPRHNSDHSAVVVWLSACDRNDFRFGENWSPAIAGVNRRVYQECTIGTTEPGLNRSNNPLSHNHIIAFVSCDTEWKTHSEDTISLAYALRTELFTSECVLISLNCRVIDAFIHE